MNERKAKNTIVKTKAHITIPGLDENTFWTRSPEINPVENDIIAREKNLGPSSFSSINKTPINESKKTPSANNL